MGWLIHCKTPLDPQPWSGRGLLWRATPEECEPYPTPPTSAERSTLDNPRDFELVEYPPPADPYTIFLESLGKLSCGI